MDKALPSYLKKLESIAKDYVPKTDEEIYNSLKDLPDFDRFPLPKDWYEKFNIPPPKIPTLRDALKAHYEAQLAYLNSPEVPVEVRPPAEGGVRPILDVVQAEMKVIPGKTLQDIDLSGNLVDGKTAESEESEGRSS